MILLLSTANTKIVSLCTILVSCYIYGCSAKDNITTGEFISDGVDYLESSEKKFQMGFFPHERTSEHGRYVGIWYTMDPNTIVWVANRDNPVMGFTGVLTVAEDGNINIQSKDGSSVFSTTTEGASPRALKLLDNGNAVLLNIESGNILWQSFKNPTDTFLPGMIMEPNIILQSWKSLEDPGSGSFKFQQISGTNRYSILNGSTTYIWKSGNMSTDSFDKNQISIKTSYLLSNTTTEKRTITKCTSIKTCTNSYEPYMVIDPYSRLVMNYSGKIQFFSWPKTKNQWVLDWQEPKVFDLHGSYPKHCSPLIPSNSSCV